MYVNYIYIMYINIVINKYVLTYIIPIDGWMTLPQQLGNVYSVDQGTCGTTRHA